jgi:hypothetical protein
MSADLKATTKRVRAAKPKWFVPGKTSHTQMDGEGRVTNVETSEVKAIEMSGARRHAFAKADKL